MEFTEVQNTESSGLIISELANDQLINLILKDIQAIYEKEKDYCEKNLNINFSVHIKEKTDIDNKTIQNWLNKRSTFFCSTLYKFYIGIHETEKSFPEFLLEFFKRKSFYIRKDNSQTVTLTDYFERKPVHQHIFRIIDEGLELSVEQVKLMFGNYGLQTTEEMKKLGIIIEKNNKFLAGRANPSRTTDLLANFTECHVKDRFDWNSLRKNIHNTDHTQSFVSAVTIMSPQKIKSYFSEILQNKIQLTQKYEKESLSDFENGAQKCVLETSILSEVIYTDKEVLQ